MRFRGVRRGAVLLVSVGFVASACGVRETSNGSDRDRNAPGGPALFSTRAVNGVALNKIGDTAMKAPIDLTEHGQSDGSTLVATTSLIADSSGFHTVARVARLLSSGEFDTTFGVDGVREIVLGNSITNMPSLGNNGELLFETSRSSADGTSEIHGVTRYNAVTGEWDQKFGGGGFLSTSDVAIRDKARYVTDDVGGIIGVASDSLTGPMYAARWTAAGRDTAFGTDGRLSLDPPAADLAMDETFSCGEPTLASQGKTIVAAFGCSVKREATNENGDILNYRRALAFRVFSRDGTVQEPDTVTMLDGPTEAVAYLSRPAIIDVDFGADEKDPYRYVTLEEYGERRVIRFTEGFASADYENDWRGTYLPTTVTTEGFLGTREFGYARYIHGDVPHFVGVTINTGAQATSLEVGKIVIAPQTTNGVQPTQKSLRIDDMPLLMHRIDRLQYVGDNVFFNLVGTASNSGPDAFINRTNLANRDGFLTVGRDGATLAPSGTANGMADSPLNKRSTVHDSFLLPGLFPANDGSMYSAEFSNFGPGGDGTVTLNVTKFDAAGKEIGQSTINVGEFIPFYIHLPINDFDGTDNFYVGGFMNGRLGVAKLSLSKGSIDRSYGTNGLAEFPSDQKIGFNFFENPWFGARLRVRPNGSIDAFSTGWAKPNGEAPSPLTIRTIRFAPNGSIDASAPDTTVTIPERSRCDCAFDSVSLAIADTAVIDDVGRIVVALTAVRHFDATGNEVDIAPGEFHGNAAFDSLQSVESSRFACVAALRACGGGVTYGGSEIRRYLRNGDVDASFGNRGVSRVSLFELGAEVPFGLPSIALDGAGNIFLTTLGLEMEAGLLGKGLVDLKVKGEYSYSIMVNSTGEPINFVPTKQNPDTQRLADLVNDSRSQFGADGTAGATPTIDGSTKGGNGDSTPVVPVEAPPGLSADVVLPPSIVTTTSGDRPVITITGTPADRAIDVRWSVPAALANAKANYTVVASPGGMKCSTSTTSCVFKKLDPWTAYSFSIKTVSAASTSVPESAPSVPVKPVRIVKRNSRTEPSKLVAPASKGAAKWKALGGCKVTSDGKSFSATKDAGLCTLSVTTAKAGKVPKTTRSITIVVRAVAK